MKPKTTKICKWKGCNKEFRAFTTIQKYCPEHEFESKREKLKSRKPQKAIKPYSEKRKGESMVYSKKRKIFLSQPENKHCPVIKAAVNGLIDLSELDSTPIQLDETGQALATEVHHKKGRKGKLLNYTPYWLAVSRCGHNWIHCNPQKAYELNFLIHSTHIHKV